MQIEILTGKVYPIKIDTSSLALYCCGMIKRTHNIDDLRLLLDYNPQDGKFVWLERPLSAFCSYRGFRTWNSRYSGKVAGTLSPDGYFSISIFKCRFLAHRLAWAIYHGKWPENDIDHINGVRGDNRIDNLRSVTRAENRKNSALHGRNTSGTSGVSWFTPASLWRARINVDGKEIALGYFKTKEEAIASRKKAEVQYNFHPNHGRLQ
jgi:hypothetical protein